MSITRINTNVDALLAGANLRKIEFSMSRTMARLSTGLRVNTAADDPSGMGLISAFKSQISGTRAATANAEDALSMMALADSVLTEISDIMIRMRDLAVRASTDATITTAQRQTMETEVSSLKAEIVRKQTAVTFNSKVLFDGSLSGGASGYVQLGPDNIAAHRFSIHIPALSVGGIGTGMSFAAIHVSHNNASGALAAIDIANSAMKGVAEMQTIIGTMEQEIERKITELQSAEVNMSAAVSRVQDADMAYEITQFTRAQVISQAATAMLAQANAQSQSILALLGM